MTEHYFDCSLALFHYYKFGNGPKKMLCFHGFGMHGKQFKSLEPELGAHYTFFGFDLLFHKQTRLKDNRLQTIKLGLTKKDLAHFIAEFCRHEQIERFSVIAYSMGTHYATAIVEELAFRIDEYIVAAPSSINPGLLISFFGKNKIGNKILEKLVLNEKAMVNILKLAKRLSLIDEVGYNIMLKEINTPELRFNLYACFTYLRFLDTEETKLIKMLHDHPIKSIFIFGKKDKIYPLPADKHFFDRYNNPEVIVLDEDHEMINQNFVATLSRLLL